MRLVTAFLVVIFLFSKVSVAQPQKKATDLGKQGLDKINAIQKQTTVLRQARPHNIMGSYSGVSTWIPSKLGLSYTYSPSVTGSWELAYSRGSVAAPFFLDDLGSITESSISLLYRSYSRRNSFSFIYGLNYYNFDARLSGEYLASVTGDPSDFNILRVRSIGVTVGLGNRWQLKNGVSLGVDWFHLNIPVNVFETDADYLNSDADPEDKEDVRDALDFLKRVPTFSFLKLQVGYTF